MKTFGLFILIFFIEIWVFSIMGGFDKKVFSMGEQIIIVLLSSYIMYRLAKEEFIE